MTVAASPRVAVYPHGRSTWYTVNMARTWLSIKVDLVGGRGERLWPRPDRVLAAARRHTFEELAATIDAFAR